MLRGLVLVPAARAPAGMAGVTVRESANPTLRGCVVRDGLEGGVMVLEHGRGTFDRCPPSPPHSGLQTVAVMCGPGSVRMHRGGQHSLRASARAGVKFIAIASAASRLKTTPGRR